MQRWAPKQRQCTFSEGGSWEGKAQEGLSQASSIPSTKPTNERRLSHSRSDLLSECWSGSEGGQTTEAALVDLSWKHETRGSEIFPLPSAAVCTLHALLEGLDEQLSGWCCPPSQGLGSQYQPLFPLGIPLGTSTW